MEKIRAIVYEGAHDIRLEEREMPSVPEGWALIRVTHAGICGSDLTTYSGTHPRAKAPLVMGHEFAGYIAEDAPGLPKGTRVTAYPNFSCGKCLPCRSGNEHVCETLKVTGIDRDGAMADYIAMPVEKLVKLPDGVSNKLGAFIEPIAVTVHAVRESGYKPGDSAIVFGCGGIGMATAITLRQFGAKNLVMSEPDEVRAEFARSLGFEVINPKECDVIAEAKARTNGDGFDWVFDCAGVQPVADVLFYVGKIKGTIAVIASYKKNPSLPMASGISRELNVRFNRVYRMVDFELAVQMAQDEPDYEKVITHVLPIEQAQKGFDLLTTPGTGAIKVMYTTLDGEGE